MNLALITRNCVSQQGITRNFALKMMNFAGALGNFKGKPVLTELASAGEPLSSKIKVHIFLQIAFKSPSNRLQIPLDLAVASL